MTSLGVDVSEHQPPAMVPWKALVALGVKFVGARCAFGLGPDKTFGQHIARSRDEGVELHLAYQVGRPIRPVLGQVELLAEACETGAWPVFDFEVLDGCEPQRVADFALEYVETADRLIGSCILYTYPFFAGPLPLSPAIRRWPLWIAHYPTKGGTLLKPTVPRPWGDWVLWQNDGDGGRRAPNGLDLDFNVYRGTVDQLRSALTIRPAPLVGATGWSAPDAVLSSVARLAAQASGRVVGGGVADFMNYPEGPVIELGLVCGNCGAPVVASGCPSCVVRHRGGPPAGELLA